MTRNGSLIGPTHFAAFLLLGALFTGPVMAAGAPTNQDIDMSYMWDLTELFATPEAWTEAHGRIRADADGLDGYQGSLGQSAGTMLAGLDAISRVQKDLARLYVYSSLKADEDLGDAPNQERRQQAGALLTVLSENTAWVAPEILELGAERVRAFQAEEPVLAERFNVFLDNTLRAAPHTLGLEGEMVIANAGDVLRQPNNIYDQLAASELPYPTVTLADATEVRLDQTAYSRTRQLPNREERKLV
ncbi:MAG: oligoendopeptidase F, partial [Alphaproteobacteria bacterium]